VLRKRLCMGAVMAALVATPLAVAACGGDGGGGGSSSAKKGDHGVINFTFAPDPVWRWLTDKGIRQEMEEKAGIKILDSSTWDEFAIYAGHHADIVSAASYEVPDIAKKSGIDSTVFGKYNTSRAVIAVKKDSPYQTLSDLKDKKIVTFTTVSDLLLWGTLGKKLEGVDLRSGGGDYDVTLADIQNLAPLVAKGDAEACVCLPDFSIKEFSSGELRPLYDGKSDGQLFAEHNAPGHEGPQSNIFLAPTDWLKSHQKEAKFFLSVWERGIKEWNEHKKEIIATYPQDFAASNKAQQKWILDYLNNQQDWFVDTVYLDQKWVDEENKLFPLMKETGFMEKDQETPKYQMIQPGT
jgi:ABC-type nitrate/sulfonate/bicarbonate transport system substrate-binding protein